MKRTMGSWPPEPDIMPTDAEWMGIGLGVLALLLGLWSIHIARSSQRFDFQQANSDLFFLRHNLSSSPADVEWISWGSVLCCHRASISQQAARPSERARFLDDFALLVGFVFDTLPGMQTRGYRQVNHLLMACENLTAFGEFEGEPGSRVAEAFERHLKASRQNMETPRAYVTRMRKTIGILQADGKYDEAFDAEYFLSRTKLV